MNNTHYAAYWALSIRQVPPPQDKRHTAQCAPYLMCKDEHRMPALQTVTVALCNYCEQWEGLTVTQAFWTVTIHVVGIQGSK